MICRLFLRTRHSKLSLLTIGIVSIIVLFTTSLSVAVNPFSDFTINIALILPIIPSLLIVVACYSPSIRQERTSARPLWPLLLAIIVAQSLIGTVILSASMFAGSWAFLDGVDAWTLSSAVGRNFLALVGCGFVSGFILGPRLSWVGPLGWLLIPPYVFPQPSDDASFFWSLIQQPGDCIQSHVLGAATWLIGLILFISPVRRH